MTEAKKTVVIELKEAEVLSVKVKVSPRGYGYLGITVKDSVCGRVWFSSSSKHFTGLQRGDKVSCTLIAYSRTQPSERFPEIMIFAKKAKDIVVTHPVLQEAVHS